VPTVQDPVTCDDYGISNCVPPVPDLVECDNYGISNCVPTVQDPVTCDDYGISNCIPPVPPVSTDPCDYLNNTNCDALECADYGISNCLPQVEDPIACDNYGIEDCVPVIEDPCLLLGGCTLPPIPPVEAESTVDTVVDTLDGLASACLRVDVCGPDPVYCNTLLCESSPTSEVELITPVANPNNDPSPDYEEGNETMYGPGAPDGVPQFCDFWAGGKVPDARWTYLRPIRYRVEVSEWLNISF
jgi:hypothetical protein